MTTKSILSQQFKKYFQDPLNELVAAGEVNKNLAEKVLALLEPVITFKTAQPPLFYSLDEARPGELDLGHFGGTHFLVMEWSFVLLRFEMFHCNPANGEEFDVLDIVADISGGSGTPVYVNFRDKPVSLRNFLASKILA